MQVETFHFKVLFLNLIEIQTKSDAPEAEKVHELTILLVRAEERQLTWSADLIRKLLSYLVTEESNQSGLSGNGAHNIDDGVNNVHDDLDHFVVNTFTEAWYTLGQQYNVFKMTGIEPLPYFTRHYVPTEKERMLEEKWIADQQK